MFAFSLRFQKYWTQWIERTRKTNYSVIFSHYYHTWSVFYINHYVKLSDSFTVFRMNDKEVYFRQQLGGTHVLPVIMKYHVIFCVRIFSALFWSQFLSLSYSRSFKICWHFWAKENMKPKQILFMHWSYSLWSRRRQHHIWTQSNIHIHVEEIGFVIHKLWTSLTSFAGPQNFSL